jgi:acid stress-induced BolA-like protein IbaG/YrbA
LHGADPHASSDEAPMETKLRKILQRVGGPTATVIIKRDDWRFVATLVAPRFEGMHEIERQEQVWEALLDELSDTEAEFLEFVFTEAPSEIVTASVAATR